MMLIYDLVLGMKRRGFVETSPLLSPAAPPIEPLPTLPLFATLHHSP